MKKTFWKIVAAAVAVLLSPIAASAGSVYQDCSPCSDVCNPCDAVCGKKASLWEVGGWVDAGIYANEYGQQNVYNDGYLASYSGNTSALQNVRQSDFQVNQTWVYFGKKLSKRGWDVGGRVDLAYGTDMLYLQSANLEYNYANSTGSDQWGTGDYYLALPQLYAEVGYNNVSVKVGKFLSTFGYESIMSPERFFYSMCYAYGIRPATQTGAIATWDVNKNFSVFGGWTNGQNQTFETEYDNAFLGGFDWKFNNRVHVGYSVMAGKNSDPYGGNNAEYNSKFEYLYQSFYVDLKLTKRANYVFEWTLNNGNGSYSYDDGNYSYNGRSHYGAYGINNEFFYKLNKRWTLGARLEWLHYYSSDNYSYGYQDSWSDDVVAFTLGANWKPTNWLIVKPEIRYDVFDEARPFNGPHSNYTNWKDSQLSGGVSAVVHF